MSPSPESSRRLAAVWFADIVGYTTLSHTDEDGAILVVEAFQRLASEIVPQYSGRVVKYVGDAALAEFASTDSAIRSALALVERFHDDDAARLHGMKIRVGWLSCPARLAPSRWGTEIPACSGPRTAWGERR